MQTIDLARQLHAARRDDTLVARQAGPTNLQQAFALQQAVSDLDDSPFVGYKVAATTVPTLALLGLDLPFHGSLKASHHHGADARITLPRACSVKVEAEFVIGIAQDLTLPVDAMPMNTISADVVARVSEAIAWVAPGLEFVGSRFDMEPQGNGLALIADGAGNVATVNGSPVTDLTGIDLPTHGVSISINDREQASGIGGDSIAGNPVAVVAWLLSQPQIAERGIKAGEFVYSGTCTGALAVTSGDTVRADFGSLGAVSVTLD